MPTQTLVDRQLKEGSILIELIKRVGMRPKAAFWYYATEVDRWSLVIQLAGLSNDFSQKDIYKRIELARRSLGADFTLPLHDIVVESPHSPLANTVRQKLAKRPGPKEGFHYIGERVGIYFIEDVYVYFL